MILGPNGKPVTATDGPTGREIRLVEHVIKGRPTWGVAYMPNDAAFVRLEVIKTLSMTANEFGEQSYLLLDSLFKLLLHAEVLPKLVDLTRAIAQDGESQAKELKIKQQVQANASKLNKEMKENQ